jgi:hypothetical protein
MRVLAGVNQSAEGTLSGVNHSRGGGLITPPRNQPIRSGYSVGHKEMSILADQ